MQTSKAERFLQALIAILVVALAAVVADSMRERIVSVGDTAPDFRIVTDGGKTITRSDFGGKVLVLNFWATWCPPCIDELPSLNALARELGPSGVVVLGISVDKNERAYQQFVRAVRLDFETARDPEADIPASYGTFKYPETYIIDSRGKVVQKHISSQNWMDPRILNSLKALL